MLEQDFLNLMQTVLNEGTKKEVFGHPDKYRMSLFGGHLLRFNLEESFPLMTTRKTPWKKAIEEFLAYISGEIDAAKLRRNKLTIWDEFAVKYRNFKYNTNYSLEEWRLLVDNNTIISEIIPTHYSNLTKKRFIRIDEREFFTPDYVEGTEDFLDQSKWVITNMQKTPYRNSFHTSMWEPETVYQMADSCGNDSVCLPACWHSHTLNFNGKLNMSVQGRSWDIIIAGAWNIAQYSALLHMYAHCMKMPVGEIEFYCVDIHSYNNLEDVAKEQLTREPYAFPKLTIKDRGQQYLQDFVIDDFTVEGYKSHPTLKTDITVVGGY